MADGWEAAEQKSNVSTLSFFRDLCYWTEANIWTNWLTLDSKQVLYILIYFVILLCWASGQWAINGSHCKGAKRNYCYGVLMCRNYVSSLVCVQEKMDTSIIPTPLNACWQGWISIKRKDHNYLYCVETFTVPTATELSPDCLPEYLNLFRGFFFIFFWFINLFFHKKAPNWKGWTSVVSTHKTHF